MKEQTRFWFVHAMDGQGRVVGLAVSAYTEASAKRQARKALGREASIDEVSALTYAHAWVIDFTWRSGRSA